eukprot:319536-Prorocentrum_minimum.AAC.2
MAAEPRLKPACRHEGMPPHRNPPVLLKNRVDFFFVLVLCRLTWCSDAIVLGADLRCTQRIF